MQHIAICDDEFEDRNHIRFLLDEYLKQHDINCLISEYHNADTLLKAFEHGEKFDCLLLDIYMPGVSGMELAKEIRLYDGICPIVFLTISKDFALEAYSVGAAQYLVKPILKEPFFETMDHINEIYQNEKRRYIIIRTKEGNFRTALRDILYCETDGNYQKIQLLSSKTLITRITSKDMYEQLNQFIDFCRCGNSFIINLSHVKKITIKQVEMDNGKKIQIPRGNYTVLKQKYFNYYC